MKQNICELDTMIFFREALEAHEFMLLPVMASAVVEYFRQSERCAWRRHTAF